MRSQKGIALIASLLIMASVMALGVGSLFLTDMNLKISENARSNALARYHAEAGLDTAFTLVADYYEKTKTFPATFSLPVTAGQSYRLMAYERYADPARAMVRVEGFTDNNARFVAEAIFQSATYRAFKGLQTAGRINLSGGGQAEFLNAEMHANGGITGLGGYTSSVFKECAWGSLQGGGEGCLTAPTTASPTPVTSSNGTTCVSPCSSNIAKPIEIKIEYSCKRNDTVAEAFKLRKVGSCDANGNATYVDPDTEQTVDINPATNPSIYNRCNRVYNASVDLINASAAQVESAGFTAGNVVCIRPGGVTFPANVNLQGVTVIAHGRINFGSTSTTGPAGNLTDVKLITRNDADSLNNGVMLNRVVGTNLTVFSGANQNLGSTNPQQPPHFLITSDFDLRGYTTIASSENIQFNGRTSVTTRPDLSKAVTIAIISAKNITNGGSFDFYGIFWAGGQFTQSGSSTIYGGVTSVGDITTTGRLRINSSYDVDNAYLMGDTVTVSRR